MQQVELTIDSREVAEMAEKDHSKLLRDLRRYEEQFVESKIGFSYFSENQNIRTVQVGYSLATASQRNAVNLSPTS